jgi:hypothetical protein
VVAVQLAHRQCERQLPPDAGSSEVKQTPQMNPAAPCPQIEPFDEGPPAISTLTAPQIASGTPQRSASRNSIDLRDHMDDNDELAIALIM